MLEGGGVGEGTQELFFRTSADGKQLCSQVLVLLDHSLQPEDRIEMME